MTRCRYFYVTFEHPLFGLDACYIYAEDAETARAHARYSHQSGTDQEQNRATDLPVKPRGVRARTPVSTDLRAV
jgi:hypothetical protein